VLPRRWHGLACRSSGRRDLALPRASRRQCNYGEARTMRLENKVGAIPPLPTA
jgi:hypothetical protein